MQNKLVDNIDRKGAGSKERSLGQTDRPKSCMWDALQKALCAPPLLTKTIYVTSFIDL